MLRDKLRSASESKISSDFNSSQLEFDVYVQQKPELAETEFNRTCTLNYKLLGILHVSRIRNTIRWVSQHELRIDQWNRTKHCLLSFENLLPSTLILRFAEHAIHLEYKPQLAQFILDTAYEMINKPKIKHSPLEIMDYIQATALELNVVEMTAWQMLLLSKQLKQAFHILETKYNTCFGDLGSLYFLSRLDQETTSIVLKTSDKFAFERCIGFLTYLQSRSFSDIIKSLGHLSKWDASILMTRWNARKPNIISWFDNLPYNHKIMLIENFNIEMSKDIQISL